MEVSQWAATRQVVRGLLGEPVVEERRERGDGYERVRVAVTVGGEEILRAEFFVLDAWPRDDVGADEILPGLEALGGRRDMPVLAVRDLVVSPRYRGRGIGRAFVKDLHSEETDAFALWPKWAGEADNDMVARDDGVLRFWKRSFDANGVKTTLRGIYLVAVKP